jgi:hypothetical protein
MKEKTWFRSRQVERFCDLLNEVHFRGVIYYHIASVYNYQHITNILQSFFRNCIFVTCVAVEDAARFVYVNVLPVVDS